MKPPSAPPSSSLCWVHRRCPLCARSGEDQARSEAAPALDADSRPTTSQPHAAWAPCPPLQTAVPSLQCLRHSRARAQPDQVSASRWTEVTGATPTGRDEAALSRGEMTALGSPDDGDGSAVPASCLMYPPGRVGEGQVTEDSSRAPWRLTSGCREVQPSPCPKTTGKHPPTCAGKILGRPEPLQDDPCLLPTFILSASRVLRIQSFPPLPITGDPSGRGLDQTQRLP